MAQINNRRKTMYDLVLTVEVPTKNRLLFIEKNKIFLMFQSIFICSDKLNAQILLHHLLKLRILNYIFTV